MINPIRQQRFISNDNREDAPDMIDLRQHWKMSGAHYHAWELSQEIFAHYVMECFAEPAHQVSEAADLTINQTITSYTVALIDTMFEYIRMLPIIEATYCIEEIARQNREAVAFFEKNKEKYAE